MRTRVITSFSLSSFLVAGIAAAIGSMLFGAAIAGPEVRVADRAREQRRSIEAGSRLEAFRDRFAVADPLEPSTAVGTDVVLDPPGTFVDVAAPERRVTESMPRADAVDWIVWSAGAADGRLIVLSMEDGRLLAQRSTDGGASFGSPIEVTGGATGPFVYFYEADATSTGTVHVIVESRDPDGGSGLTYVRGDDYGLTWSTPLALVDGADPAGSSFWSRIDGRGNRVAVFTASVFTSGQFVTVSEDNGVTWTTPVRIDPSLEPGGDFFLGDVAIDDYGNVHAVYCREEGGLYAVYYTRSTDGGATFESERSFDSLMAPGSEGYSVLPTLEIASDGGVLVSFYDGVFNRLYVVRSTDQGVNFSTALQEDLTSSYDVGATITSVPGSATVLIVTSTGLGSTGPLEVRRSTDHGASFGVPVRLTDRCGGWIGNDRVPRPVRTQSGRWGIAWTEETSRQDQSIAVSTSADDGVTWSPWTEANVPAPSDSLRTTYGQALATVYPNRLVVSYYDNRGLRHGGYDIYSAWSDATTIDFASNDRRIDGDSTTAPARVDNDPAPFSDGDDRMYAVFTARSLAGNSEVYVVASADRGLTWGPAVRASGDPEDGYVNFMPVGAAVDDGHVYVVYLRRHGDADLEIRFSRSVDHGQTWTIADLPLKYEEAYVGNLQVLATREGFVYVVWGTGNTYWIARSGDYGSTFYSQDYLTGDGAVLRSVRACAQGYQIVVGHSTSSNAWATFSRSGGSGSDPWEPLEQIVTGLSIGSQSMVVTCDGSSSALVAVLAGPTGSTTASGRRLDRNLGWEPVTVTLAADASRNTLSGAFASRDAVVLAYTSADGREIHVSHSTDGGRTFPSTARLDDVAPSPSAWSSRPFVASDRAGNAWVVWLDDSPGGAWSTSIAMRESNDGGASWGAVERVHHDLPQGGASNRYVTSSYAVRPPLATDDELVAVGWRSDRDAAHDDGYLMVNDMRDRDKDGVEKDVDCDDVDAAVWSVPGAIADLRFAADKITLNWSVPAVDGGEVTDFDVLRSDDPTLFGPQAVWIETDDTERSSVDTDTPVTAGLYAYLVRANNRCGEGLWGADSGGGTRPVDPPPVP